MKKTLITAALATIALGALPAHATTYCRSGPISVHDGAIVTTSWDMTSARARRVLHPSQTAPTTHCSSNWRVLGGFYRPIEIIERPRLNTATSGRYAVNYRALNPGNDRMVIKIYWVSRTNRTFSATVIYNIQVVDHEL